MTAQPFVGTAGWTVPARYAESVPPGDSHLERYAGVLNAAEINSSFHRPHRRSTYERWAASTPPQFRFSAKMPKAITHQKRLVGCEPELDRFAEEVAGLGGKLAILLVQMPPSAALETGVADVFIAAAGARFGCPLAFEPRHPSWFTPDADGWLAAHGICRVAADPARVPEAAEPGGDTRLVYYRWHGSPRMYASDYDASALDALSARLREFQAAGCDVWCMFDNTMSGAALGNALSLSRNLHDPGAS
jgi:uncharacterized protein YecE (DUF72 family)